MAKKNKRKNSREPSEYDLSFEPEEQEEAPRVKYSLTMAYLIDQDEVNALIEASTAAYIEPPGPVVDTHHSTYVEWEVVALIAGTYNPNPDKPKKKK